MAARWLLPLWLTTAAGADVELNCQIFDSTMLCDNDKQRVARAEIRTAALGQVRNWPGKRDWSRMWSSKLHSELRHLGINRYPQSSQRS
eukprot:scaffold117302_cov30-Tisochrysis_lutea.AAC.1